MSPASAVVDQALPLRYITGIERIYDMTGLRSEIAKTLSNDIDNRRIKQGAILLERDVAARFDVSKTPAREALAILCAEGLVQLFPRRGYVVRTLDLTQVMDTFDLRLILEGAAAQRAARNLNEAQLDQLDRLKEH